MEKCWYVLIKKKPEGPYSINELRYLRGITPDTLAWKEGFANWIPIRNIPELAEIFEDEEEPEVPTTKISGKEEGALSIELSEPPYFLWLLVIILALIYAIFQLSRDR